MSNLTSIFRTCEYCGCYTNAKMRQCCAAGYRADFNQAMTHNPSRGGKV